MRPIPAACVQSPTRRAPTATPCAPLREALRDVAGAEQAAMGSRTALHHHLGRRVAPALAG